MSPGIWKWADRLGDVPEESHRLTLGEGGTPLIRSRRIGPAIGLTKLFFKLESSNPTGSYKDRFAAAAISHLLARGKSRGLATSSGNTGAALAAACAFLNRALDRVLGHGLPARCQQSKPQARVHIWITAPQLCRHGNFPPQLGKNFGARRILPPLAVFNIRPFGMTCHARIFNFF